MGEQPEKELSEKPLYAGGIDEGGGGGGGVIVRLVDVGVSGDDGGVEDGDGLVEGGEGCNDEVVNITGFQL
jgi:hypothetical protein